MNFIIHYLIYAISFFALSVIWNYGDILVNDFKKSLDYHTPIREVIFASLLFPYTIAKKIYRLIVD